MVNPIVVVQTSVSLAPTPSKLQQTGALISAGGTTLASGTYSLLTQDSDLTPLLSAPLAITSLTWSGGTVIVNAASAIPGRTTGDSFRTTIAGTSPAGFSGLVLATVTGTNSFSYPLAVNPGAEVTPGTYSPPGQGELVAEVDTFFAQNTAQAVYVLELGPSDGTSGPPILFTFIQNNPLFFYSYLVPKSWDGTAAFAALQANYTSPSAKTYFFTSTTTTNYVNYNTKNIIMEVTAPAAPLTEFSLAAAFQASLAINPNSVERMTPFCFTYLFGVTPYPLQGNGPLITQLIAGNCNYVGTGAEGGLSNLILRNGKVASGIDFGFWFAADWVAINSDINLAAAVITGSNNKINPLVYNQSGINQLQDVAAGTINTGISYGLLNGGVTTTALDPITFSNNLNNGVYAGQNVINAVPFLPYTAANPSDYGQGVYNGITVVCLPQVGFTQIGFALLVTDLLSL